LAGAPKPNNPAAICSAASKEQEMVTEVKAHRLSDGRLVEDHDEALEEQCKLDLKACIGEPCTVEIMQKLLAVHKAITPLVEEITARAKLETRNAKRS
jgi:hypothetical protein